MSQKRQSGIFDRSGDLKSAITTLTHDYPAGHVVPLDFHDRDQLVYASQGVMTVRTRNGTWVVPPHRAVWIPAEIPHTITMSGLGGDANPVSEATPRKRAATRLLRDQCLNSAQGTDSSCFARFEKDAEMAGSLDWSDPDQFETVQMVPLQLLKIALF